MPAQRRPRLVKVKELKRSDPPLGFVAPVKVGEVTPLSFLLAHNDAARLLTRSNTMTHTTPILSSSTSASH